MISDLEKKKISNHDTDKEFKTHMALFNNVIKDKTTKKFFSVFSVYKGLPRSIYFLFGIKIVNAMGNFVFPFLAIYLKKIGISASHTGALLTIAALSFAPGAILGGKLADHIGRKKVFMVAQLASVILFIPCAFLNGSMITPGLLILSSFFNGGSQPPLSAMVNDLTDQSNRKQSISLLYLGNNIGFAFGSMIAGFMFAHYTKMLFIGNFITGFLAVAILFKYIKETKPKFVNKEEVPESEKAEKGSVLAVLLKRPIFITFALLSSIYSFVYAQFPFCGSLQLGPQLYGVLMSLNGFVVITMTTPIINFTQKIKPLLNISLAGVFFAIGFGMLYFVKSFPLYVMSSIIWATGEVLNTTNVAVYIANNTPSSHRGRFNSAIQIITGAGFALGPILMGLYINGKGVRDAWPLIFSIETIAAMLVFGLYLIELKKEKA